MVVLFSVLHNVPPPSSEKSKSWCWHYVQAHFPTDWSVLPLAGGLPTKCCSAAVWWLPWLSCSTTRCISNLREHQWSAGEWLCALLHSLYVCRVKGRVCANQACQCILCVLVISAKRPVYTFVAPIIIIYWYAGSPICLMDKSGALSLHTHTHTHTNTHIYTHRFGVYDSLYAPANPFMLQHQDDGAGNGTSADSLRLPGQTGRWKTGSESEVRKIQAGIGERCISCHNLTACCNLQ